MHNRNSTKIKSKLYREKRLPHIKYQNKIHDLRQSLLVKMYNLSETAKRLPRPFESSQHSTPTVLLRPACPRGWELEGGSSGFATMR